MGYKQGWEKGDPTGTPVQKKEINKNVGVVPLANPDIRNNNKRRYDNYDI